MKKIFITAFSITLLGLTHLAFAGTADGSLVTSGRSIPENSISINADQGGVVTNDVLVATATKAASPITGDPDFDLLKKAASSAPAGDPDFDLIKTAPPTENPLHKESNPQGVNPLYESDKKVTPPPSPLPPGDPDFDLLRISAPTPSSSPKITGDPDFDLLSVHFSGEDLDQLRSQAPTASSTELTKKVTVRGWDPEKKEEIVGHPEAVKTAEDLNVYVQAVALSDDAIEGITLKEHVLGVQSRESGKLFWFIPVEMSTNVEVQFNPKELSVDRVKVKFPWWHVFVQDNSNQNALEKELAGVFDPAKWQKVDNSEASVGVSQVAQVLHQVSNVLKTKHDTVKNSVGNIR